jgi:hypothetical protein
MLGWWVVVDSRTPAERDASDDKKMALVASWEAPVFNIRFLDDLVKQGKAKQLKFNGYPNRYTVTVDEFAPFVLNGPPALHGENTKVVIELEKIAALSSDHLLTIDVWDQS